MRKLVLLCLSLLGLFDASYLWWMYVSPSQPMVCAGNGCDAVRASSYAHFGGIPTPAFGVAMYAVLALLIFVGPLAAGRWERRLSYAVAGISGAGFLVSLALTAVEAFVVHNWCEWCVTSAVTVTLIFALAIFELFRPSPAVEGEAALASLRKYVTAVMVGILAGVPAFIFLSRAQAEGPVSQASDEALRNHLVRPYSHVFGDPNAPVTVVEFADFQCPFCGEAEKTVSKIRQAYKTRVRFIFRHYPIPEIHPFAEKAAEASECAAQQGDFWKAYDKFYSNQDDLSVPALEHYASELGLDRARFDQCLSSGAMAARVQQDKEDGRALGVDRTPTFFIDGRKILGAPSYEQFARLLDAELASRGLSAPASESSMKQPVASPQGRTQAAPPASSSTASSPASPTGSSTGFLGTNTGSSMFSSSDSSLAGCSADEADQTQPALIDTAQARRIFEGGSKAVFVDVRSLADFQKARIRGAVSIPLDDFEKRWSQLPKDRDVVLYESGRSAGAQDVCAAGRAAGRFLLSHGFSRSLVKVYHDGLKGWEKAGLPIATGNSPGS